MLDFEENFFPDNINTTKRTVININSSIFVNNSFYSPTNGSNNPFSSNNLAVADDLNTSSKANSPKQERIVSNLNNYPKIDESMEDIENIEHRFANSEDSSESEENANNASRNNKSREEQEQEEQEENEEDHDTDRDSDGYDEFFFKEKKFQDPIIPKLPIEEENDYDKKLEAEEIDLGNQDLGAENGDNAENSEQEKEDQANYYTDYQHNNEDDNGNDNYEDYDKSLENEIAKKKLIKEKGTEYKIRHKFSMTSLFSPVFMLLGVFRMVFRAYNSILKRLSDFLAAKITSITNNTLLNALVVNFLLKYFLGDFLALFQFTVLNLCVFGTYYMFISLAYVPSLLDTDQNTFLTNFPPEIFEFFSFLLPISDFWKDYFIGIIIFFSLFPLLISLCSPGIVLVIHWFVLNFGDTLCWKNPICRKAFQLLTQCKHRCLNIKPILSNFREICDSWGFYCSVCLSCQCFSSATSRKKRFSLKRKYFLSKHMSNGSFLSKGGFFNPAASIFMHNNSNIFMNHSRKNSTTPELKVSDQKQTPSLIMQAQNAIFSSIEQEMEDYLSNLSVVFFFNFLESSCLYGDYHHKSTSPETDFSDFFGEREKKNVKFIFQKNNHYLQRSNKYLKKNSIRNSSKNNEDFTAETEEKINLIEEAKKKLLFVDTGVRSKSNFVENSPLLMAVAEPSQDDLFNEKENFDAEFFNSAVGNDTNNDKNENDENDNRSTTSGDGNTSSNDEYETDNDNDNNYISFADILSIGTFGNKIQLLRYWMKNNINYKRLLTLDLQTFVKIPMTKRKNRKLIDCTSLVFLVLIFTFFFIPGFVVRFTMFLNRKPSVGVPKSNGNFTILTMNTRKLNKFPSISNIFAPQFEKFQNLISTIPESEVFDMRGDYFARMCSCQYRNCFHCFSAIINHYSPDIVTLQDISQLSLFSGHGNDAMEFLSFNTGLFGTFHGPRFVEEPKIARQNYQNAILTRFLVDIPKTSFYSVTDHTNTSRRMEIQSGYVRVFETAEERAKKSSKYRHCSAEGNDNCIALFNTKLFQANANYTAPPNSAFGEEFLFNFQEKQMKNSLKQNFQQIYPQFHHVKKEIESIMPYIGSILVGDFSKSFQNHFLTHPNCTPDSRNTKKLLSEFQKSIGFGFVDSFEKNSDFAKPEHEKGQFLREIICKPSSQFLLVDKEFAKNFTTSVKFPFDANKYPKLCEMNPDFCSTTVVTYSMKEFYPKNQKDFL